ncbi:hypothetical protein ACIQBJ_16730 [Kitasatospora sp. NPDC088391]|uniref:hypothetical protein n=1 Tax=Kitasatospora sp. NPDC088391 TaxID=3364074 RepID=UPI003830BC09
MTSPLDPADPARARALAGIGEPVLAVADEPRGLLAVAGADRYGQALRLGVFGTGARPALLREFACEYPVNALAFHPDAPLLAVGTGEYDGGYAFLGALLLIRLDTWAVRPLFAEGCSRSVLDVRWTAQHRLRLHLAPYDDDGDEAAHEEAHLVTVERAHWPAAPARSLTNDRLQGPRVPYPHPDSGPGNAVAAEARRLTDRLLRPPSHRHNH